MQQRRLRLGDTVDDYCPRERRVTNHAIAAMVDDQITHTRCTACEADHEYKEGRAPRRKREDAPSSQPPGGRIVPHTAPEEEAAVLAALESVSVSVVIEDPAQPGDADGDNAGNREEDNWLGHRRLIRATFPRPEGQPPEWKEPEFTNRQPTHQRRGRFGHGGGQGEPNGNRAGQARRGGGGGGRGPFQHSGGGQPRGGDGNRSGGGPWQGGGRPGGGGQGQPGQGQGEGGGGRRRRRRGR